MPDHFSPQRRSSVWEISGYSLAGILLLGTLLVLLFQERTRREKATCQDNLRQIGQALQMYVTDNDDTWPVMSKWWYANRTATKPFAGCPSATKIPPLRDHPGVTIFLSPIPGYAYNSFLDGNGSRSDKPIKHSIILFPATAVCVSEEASDIPMTLHADYLKKRQPIVDREDGSVRHNSGANYLFCDGHVQWFPPKAVRGAEEFIVGHERHPDGKVPDFLLK